MRDSGAGSRDASVKAAAAQCGKGTVAIVVACALICLSAGAANARPTPPPPKPVVHTGGAADVSYAMATLTGAVNPRKIATYYYFQYGPTDAYGLQTPLAEAGAGGTAVPVSVAIGGLSPLTIYHYRLVGVSAAGTTLGADHALKTTKVPLSLQIVSSPDPVGFGGAVTIQGTLSGTGNVNREVVLQANAFPFTAGFVDVGNPELTSSTGGFSFALLNFAATSQFRVVTTTQPAVISPVATESVSVLVSANHAPAKRRHRVRIYGTVTPAENGMSVQIMRLNHGHETIVGAAVLQADGPDHSSYLATVHRHRGLYKVYAAVSGAQSAASSAPLYVR